MKRKDLMGILGFLALLFPAIVVWAAPVPDTGVTKCYNDSVEIPCPSPGQSYYWQDANYGLNPMSYTKLDETGNALPEDASSWVMVRDNVTGLIWENKTDDGTIHDANNTYNWYDPSDSYPGTPGDGTDTKDFIDALNDAHFGGYTDWRLPSIKELDAIVSYDIPYPGPTINTSFFPNTQASYYWSSTDYAFNNNFAWAMSFYYGYNDHIHKDSKFYVRAVRGEQSQSAYVDNGDGTVSDTSTGLMWQQDIPDDTMTWEQALSYCEISTLAGYTDWRLPTKKELRNLVDYSHYSPAINTMYFPYTLSAFYWSSTTSAYSTYAAWGEHFYDGYDIGSYKSNYNHVRAIRAEQSGPVAICKDVTISINSNCIADASIDNGSYDPDGDPITLSQSPSGPYPLGNTLVTLTVTDDKGASSQCTGTVTVVDATTPKIIKPSTTPSVLWPPNKKMVDVTVNYSVTDNCNQTTCKISGVISDELISSLDYTIVDAHHVKLRADRLGKGKGRVYKIIITCMDASGNTSNMAVMVFVPHVKGKRK